jgi:hypothetical protein
MAVEQPISGAQSAADLRSYLDEMWRRLPDFAVRAATLPADERGSFEWQAAAGRFWWTAREQAGLTRDEAARRLGCSVNELRLLEFGLLTRRAFGGRRLRAYAQRLGDADLYTQFQDRFER